MAKAKKTKPQEVPAISELNSHPLPPAELSEAEAEVWVTTVSTKHVGYYSADFKPNLIAYCHHTVQAQILDQAIKKLPANSLDVAAGIAWYEKLTDMRNKQTNIIMRLASSMRMTPQARYTPKSAGANKMTPNPKAIGNPWDAK